MVSKYQGESERLIRNLFELAREKAPSVIFVDEIDSLCSSRSDGDNDSTRRIKTEFLVQMDGVGKINKNVLILGATNLPWLIEPAMRRRFEKRIYIPLPDSNARKVIISQYLKTEALFKCSDNEISQIVELTEGYSGSDISTMMKDALMQPVRKCQTASQFIQNENNKWSPCLLYPNCHLCPMNLSNDSSINKQCTNCNALCTNLYNLNSNELELPALVFDDVLFAAKNVSKTITSGDFKKLESWTKEFGSSGA